MPEYQENVVLQDRMPDEHLTKFEYFVSPNDTPLCKVIPCRK